MVIDLFTGLPGEIKKVQATDANHNCYCQPLKREEGLYL